MLPVDAEESKTVLSVAPAAWIGDTGLAGGLDPPRLASPLISSLCFTLMFKSLWLREN